MNSFFEKLANSSSHGQSSDHLKLLGKRAAGMFSSGETGNLNDAVYQVVNSENLNKDQVARITEMANQETWKALFVDGGDRQVNFDPADPTVVIGQMSARPQVIDDDRLTDLDFSSDVPNQRPPMDEIAEAFRISKDAPEYEALSSTTNELQSVEKTASAVDLSRYALDNAANLLAEAGETFYHLVKQAHLNDDHGILQIAKAVSSAVDDSAFARDLMQQVSLRLANEGVRFNERVELEKVSHVLVVNHEHPLLQAAANLERSAYSFYAADDAHEKLSAAHKKACYTLQSKMRKRR